MTEAIVATRLRVEGLRDDNDVRRALQALYDVFADQDLGQATFELHEGELADLWIKHKDDVTPDREALNRALSQAGEYRIV